MGNNTGLLIVLVILIVGAIFYFQPEMQINGDTQNGDTQITDGELKRSVPLEVNPGETFEIIYSSDKAGQWGVIIVDGVSGGCKFPAGIEYKSVMLGDGSDLQVVEVTAPSSGSCTFHGDYNFGSNPIKDFPDQTVKIK